MFSNVVITVLLSWVMCTNSKIIFNQHEFIMEISFENIQSGVRSGYMKCGLENERLELDENKYNGTHIIFRYERSCGIRDGIDHTKKENVYNERFACSYKLVDPILSERRCNGRIWNFLIEDTCAITYDKACDETILGPCIGKVEGKNNRNNQNYKN